MQIWQANASNDVSETGALIQLSKPSCYSGIHQDQCVQSELSSCGFQKVAANKNRIRLDYAERIHITELQTGLYASLRSIAECQRAQKHTLETMQTLEGHLSSLLEPFMCCGGHDRHMLALCSLDTAIKKKLKSLTQKEKKTNQMKTRKQGNWEKGNKEKKRTRSTIPGSPG